MPAELTALLDKPWMLAAVLVLGACLGMGVERFVERQRRAERRAYWGGRKAGRLLRGTSAAPLRTHHHVLVDGTTERASVDATAQLRVVMEAEFRARPLLNDGERRLLVHLDRALEEHAPGWRAMGQVSLGEILSSTDVEAYRAINSKRVDLLIVDADCRPLHAVEFQGKGHHQGTAAARDAVKKEALRRAGIGYVEIVSGDTPADVRDYVRKLFQRGGGVVNG